MSQRFGRLSLAALTCAIAMFAATPAAHADILQLNGRNVASLFNYSGQSFTAETTDLVSIAFEYFDMNPQLGS